MAKCGNNMNMQSNAAVVNARVVDRTPCYAFITNSSSGNCMYRNRLLGVHPAASSFLPAAATAAATTTAAAITSTSATGATNIRSAYNSLPMHVRARKLASKIMMSDKSSPATRANAGAVQESFAMEDKSLVTLLRMWSQHAPRKHTRLVRER